MTKKDKNWNFSNFYINMFCLVVVIPLLIWAHKTYYKVIELGLLEFLLVSIFIYIWSSRFFQPDLDHPMNRPGKTTFPLGDTSLKIIQRFLRGTLYIILKDRAHDFSHTLVYGTFKFVAGIWNLLWFPYAFLFTHRGFSHIPILGTLTRVFYISFIGALILGAFRINTDFIYTFAESFLFWRKITPYTFLIALPIYLSDFFHSAGDLAESMIKGYSFCPPGIRRGFLTKIFRITI